MPPFGEWLPILYWSHVLWYCSYFVFEGGTWYRVWLVDEPSNYCNWPVVSDWHPKVSSTYRIAKSKTFTSSPGARLSFLFSQGDIIQVLTTHLTSLPFSRLSMTQVSLFWNVIFKGNKGKKCLLFWNKTGISHQRGFLLNNYFYPKYYHLLDFYQHTWPM